MERPRTKGRLRGEPAPTRNCRFEFAGCGVAAGFATFARTRARGEVPEILVYPSAPQSWRRMAALHRELSRPSANGTHFLSYRDAAKACVGLSHQQAHD